MLSLRVIPQFSVAAELVVMPVKHQLVSAIYQDLSTVY